MALRLLSLRRRALSSLQKASLRHFDSGTQRLVKGSHRFLGVSSFHTSHFRFDEVSEKDRYSEDVTVMKGVDNEFCLDKFENPKASFPESSTTVCQTAEHNDCVEVTESDQAVENGLEIKAINATSPGIYKAILMGEAGYAPSQKIFKNGSTVTLFSLGTSGMRNNRKPYENETPDQYARRSLVQWHRIAIYQFRLGALAMKSIKKGSYVYVEGNLETRLFLDPESNSIKRIQEIAVRQNGRIMFLDQNKPKSQSNLEKMQWMEWSKT